MAHAKSITHEKVELLLRMGCASVSMGFESGNEWIRRNVLNRKETTEVIIEATKLLNEAGIRTSSFNMLGLPFETRDAIFDTIELNRKSEVAYPDVSFFFPYEGTELFKVCIDNGFWIPDPNAAFRSDKPALLNATISAEELIAIRDRFVFYVKLPTDFWPYIRRSETLDYIGAQLTTGLYQIYQNTIFSNIGRMPKDYYIQADISFLENIISEKVGKE
jgi:hypothetical protein